MQIPVGEHEMREMEVSNQNSETSSIERRQTAMETKVCVV